MLNILDRVSVSSVLFLLFLDLSEITSAEKTGEEFDKRFRDNCFRYSIISKIKTFTKYTGNILLKCLNAMLLVLS